MPKALLPFAILAAFTVTGGVTGAAPLLEKRITLAGISATIHVTEPAENQYIISVSFPAGSKYPVGCLSAFRDFRYDLRDSAGNIVPVNQHALAHPPYDGPVVNGPPRPCSLRGAGGWGVRAQLSSLYPNLPSGTYSLTITFVPHGTGKIAVLPPVSIIISDGTTPN